MEVHLTLFGQLTDITGKSDLILQDIPDTETLIKTLHERYPSLANTTYAIALNKKIIVENTVLSGDPHIALLPAFSGG